MLPVPRWRAAWPAGGQSKGGAPAQGGSKGRVGGSFKPPVPRWRVECPARGRGEGGAPAGGRRASRPPMSPSSVCVPLSLSLLPLLRGAISHLAVLSVRAPSPLPSFSLSLLLLPYGPPISPC